VRYLPDIGVEKIDNGSDKDDKAGWVPRNEGNPSCPGGHAKRDVEDR